MLRQSSRKTKPKSSTISSSSSSGCRAAATHSDFLFPDELEEEQDVEAEAHGLDKESEEFRQLQQSQELETQTHMQVVAFHGESGTSEQSPASSQQWFEEYVTEWAARFCERLELMSWVSDCRTSHLRAGAVSLIEFADSTQSCGSGEPDPCSGVSVSYRIVHWDTISNIGPGFFQGKCRTLNKLDSESQRVGKLGYIPPAEKKELRVSVTHSRDVDVPVPVPVVLLHDIGVQMVRPKYLRPDLPEHLLPYLSFLESLQAADALLPEMESWQR